jgi:chorismate mutase
MMSNRNDIDSSPTRVVGKVGSILMSADSGAVRCRGVRGATFIDEDTPEAILAGTRELLAAIAQANGIATEDIASAFFTSTADLRTAFPARAARDLGWTDVPLLGATEVDKLGAPPRCIRVLLHWNTSRRQDEIVHVYLHGSDVMRAQDPPSHLASLAHAAAPSA